MLRLTDELRDRFRHAVLEAAGRAEVCDAVGNVYRALQDAIDLRRPVCRTSGRCCRFDEFGHRLFVTTMELATFVAARSVEKMPRAEPGTCPFQIGGLCGTHAIRPFGCRVFFCDATASDWQREQYERFHKEIRRLHEERDVEYFYVEWVHAVNALGALESSL